MTEELKQKFIEKINKYFEIMNSFHGDSDGSEIDYWESVEQELLNYKQEFIIKEINFENFNIISEKCKELAKIKNKQYGIKNLLIFDGLGILTRINDKIARLNNLFDNWKNIELCGDLKSQNQINETLDDTLLDLINYSVYLYLYKNNLLFK